MALAAALAAELPLTVDVPTALARAVDPDALAAAEVEEAPADDTAPLIWAWTVELKVPVMPVRLFEPLRGRKKIKKSKKEGMTHANFAENAWAGNWVLLGLGALLDWILIKLAGGGLAMTLERGEEHSLAREVGSNSGRRSPSL